MDLSILSVSSQGCAIMDNANCYICEPGFKIFRGRCHVVQN